ncbi:MAG: Holliday junction resolvase RuvX, partial [Betaproteobacteria bacterium]|nr:Holliday junction resolvase RuvX [Betaproteobacteria bacterium]
PVHYINETLSSHEAAALLRQQGIRGREQQTHLDAAAAQVILQSFLDNPLHP